MYTLAHKRNIVRSFQGTRAKAIAITETPAAYWLLLAMLVASCALYIVFINQTVHNVVNRSTLEKRISALTSNIGELETQDFALSSTITLDKAHELGFSEVASTTFLARAGAPEVAMNRTH